jgi:hypothetical protein
MNDSFDQNSFLILIACLVLGGLYAWLLYGKTSLMPKGLLYGLAALRTIVVATIVWMLFSPLIKQVLYTLEKPIIIIGQDNSRSIEKEPANFNNQKYKADMEALKMQLSKKYEVRTYHFSDSVKPGYDFSYGGKLTNASNFIHVLTDGYLNRNVGAVIMATDGIFNRGGNPLYEIAGLKAPVYTIALGDTIPKKDLLISNVNYNDLVYLDNDFNIEIQLQAYKSKGARTQLTVLENGKSVHQEQLIVAGDPYAKTYTVKLKATKMGIQKYTVSVSQVSNEASVKNNSQTFLIEAIDDRQKVLIAAAAPHPDVAALKQAIELNKHYEVKVAVGEELTDLKPENYGLIILYQLPGLNFPGNKNLKNLTAGKASFWYIIGAKTDLNAFNRMQGAVNISGSSDLLTEAYSTVNPGFTPFSLSEEAKKTLAKYDPLQAPSAKLNFNVSISTLFLQQSGRESTGIPQLFFSTGGGRKTGYLFGEGLWRWKLSEARAGMTASVFNPLISQIVQFLSVKDDKRRFKAYPSMRVFDENEPVLINATLYNDSYVAVNKPDVNAVLKDEKGKTYNYTFSKSESAYQLDAGILKPGDYTFTAKTQLGDQKYVEKGAFYVKALVAEDQQTIANHQVLYALSAKTNGRMVMPQNLLDLVKDLVQNEQIKTISYEDRNYAQLIDLRWLFFLIMGLLSVEWFLRKRNGEI